jgi:hypothetical protein
MPGEPCPLCGVGHAGGCSKGVLNEEGKLVMRPQIVREPMCEFCNRATKFCAGPRSCPGSLEASALREKEQKSG